MGVAASSNELEAASEAADRDATSLLSSDLDNTIFADIRVGTGLIATYAFASFEDLNAALASFLASVDKQGIRHRFKPQLVVESVQPSTY